MKRLFGKKKKRSPVKTTADPPHPLYHFAIQEYHQTVAPKTSNDDGRAMALPYSDFPNAEATPRRDTAEAPPSRSNPTPLPSQEEYEGIGSGDDWRETLQPEIRSRSSTTERESIHAQSSTRRLDLEQHSMRSPEPEMPDTTYEEQYGDAYVGAPIKYVYPSGYQSMRPRGGPWKLSIAVCLLFTWLSIFIVGHCSDRANLANEIDDDTLAIEVRWCGSGPLHTLWAISMLITGLSAAYCSVIGYIKLRDFAVANCRSQPPGMVGKSDYYVRIDDHPPGHSPAGSTISHASYHYQKTIYQADGTPQFWGGHIYRPTQAAVAVTSR